MRTRSKSYPNNSNATIPRRSNRRRVPNIVEPEIRTIEEVVPMADRPMEELLQAPMEGDVPNDAIKLMLFSYSLEGAARIWYEKEPPNSILTWDDLVNKFVNQNFPPSKTTHLKNEISRFTQRFEETFFEMSRDVLTVGSTMMILLLYRGEYSQRVERFMNYLKEQTDGEAMINSIKNGDQPLPRVTQVSIARTTSTEQPLLKDKSMWKAAVLYKYETFKATEGELLLDTCIRYLQVINDLKKCGYSKDNCELNFKFLNNLQPEWKQYATMMRQNKNLMDITIDALYNILKQNQGDVNDAMGLKKKTVVVTSDPLALIAEKTNVSKTKEKVVVSSNSEGSEADDFRHFAKDCQKAKVKDYKYYKTKMLHAKKDKDEQVLLAEDQAWMESGSDSDQKINANMEKYAKLEAERYEYMIRYFAYFDNDKQHRKQIADQQVLSDKMSVQLLELDKHVRGISFENPRYFEKAKDLIPTLYDEKIIIDLEDEVVNLLEKEKVNLETIESLKSKSFESSEKVCSESENQSENDRLVVEKECDKEDNPKIVQICLWIIDSGCSKHMTGNRTLLTNFVKKFLGTVRFGNSDFAVIAGYGDVVIGSMTIKKVYYVEGLGHNLFSVGQFSNKGLKVAFRKSTCFVRNKDGVDLLTDDRSSNLYTIALSHLNFATINNLVKNNLVQGLPKMKFEKDHLCFACEQGKIH
nr:hypothetical protein [Tanacetum cinerariifolium]